MYYYIISFKTVFISDPEFLFRPSVRRFFFVLVYIWNGTSTHDGEQLCQVTMKSIGKCRSYVVDKAGCTDTTPKQYLFCLLAGDKKKTLPSVPIGTCGD